MTVIRRFCSIVLSVGYFNLLEFFFVSCYILTFVTVLHVTSFFQWLNKPSHYWKTKIWCLTTIDIPLTPVYIYIFTMIRYSMISVLSGSSSKRIKWGSSRSTRTTQEPWRRSCSSLSYRINATSMEIIFLPNQTKFYRATQLRKNANTTRSKNLKDMHQMIVN